MSRPSTPDEEVLPDGSHRITDHQEQPAFPPRRRGEPAAEFYARVAEAYLRLRAETGKPTTGLAQLAGVKTHTAGNWVNKARTLGLLPAATRGRMCPGHCGPPVHWTATESGARVGYAADGCLAQVIIDWPTAASLRGIRLRQPLG